MRSPRPPLPRARGSGRAGRPVIGLPGVRRRAAASFAALLALLQLLAGAVLAESPSPSAAIGDPRSSGQGPGLVGDPLLAVGVVLLIGLGSVLASLAYVRVTGGPRR